MGPASPDSHCDDTLSDPIWKSLSVPKCKWLDAWKPKWEARFYMGQREEDYRTDKQREDGGRGSHVNCSLPDTPCHLHYGDCCIKGQCKGAQLFFLFQCTTGSLVFSAKRNQLHLSSGCPLRTWNYISDLPSESNDQIKFCVLVFEKHSRMWKYTAVLRWLSESLILCKVSDLRLKLVFMSSISPFYCLSMLSYLHVHLIHSVWRACLVKLPGSSKQPFNSNDAFLLARKNGHATVFLGNV